MLAVVLLAALLVARTCGSSEPGISKEEAIEIAKSQIRFEPDRVQVRNVPRGFRGERSWAVSLYTGTFGNPSQCRLVEIDADTETVIAIRRC